MIGQPAWQLAGKGWINQAAQFMSIFMNTCSETAQKRCLFFTLTFNKTSSSGALLGKQDDGTLRSRRQLGLEVVFVAGARGGWLECDDIEAF
jgi:hypothetical protein